jgi:hypothetical protein
LPPREPPPLDFGACDELLCDPPLPCDWLGAAERAGWLGERAGLGRVAGRDVFWRNAGLDGWRAELEDCELNVRESKEREPGWPEFSERELDERKSNWRESNERALFCCARVELFGARETAFSR